MTRAMRALSAPAAFLLALLVACTTTPPASLSPSPDQGAATPWQQELANLELDGMRTLDSALKLMAMAYGPIPGIEAPIPAEGEVGSSTPALRVVRASLDQLTPEQRTVVDGYLALPADAETIEIPPADPVPPEGSGVSLASLAYAIERIPYGDFEKEIAEDAQAVRTMAAWYFGGDIPRLRVRSFTSEGYNVITFFNSQSQSDSYGDCDVFVNKAQANYNRFETRRSIGLDVVHCFQAWKMQSDLGALRRVPAWAWEGPAEFIMLDAVGRAADSSDDVWPAYLLYPDVSLFQRSYDAAGFYAQLQWSGISLRDNAVFTAVLTDVDNPERFALAGATENKFLDAWASELNRLPTAWGHDWNFDGPHIPGSDVAAPREPVTVANGSERAVSQSAYSNHEYAIFSTADIIVFEFFGRARVSDGQVDRIIRDAAIFCTTPKGCEPCPDGVSLGATALAADSILAVGGGTDGTAGTITGHALEEFCRPTPRPTPPASDEPEPSESCANGCAMSNGDPHMITVDGKGYDFMATGEFVLLRAQDGSFEMQSRQEPVASSTTVSLNSALALRAGSSRIGFYTDRDSDRPVITVDGEAVALDQPMTIGDAELRVSGKTATVGFSDGTSVVVVGSYHYGLQVAISPSGALAANAVGLLGRVPAGSLLGIPALPDGSVLPDTTTRDEFYATVYGPFADAWRVPDGGSLFDYPDGASSDSYITPGFPDLTALIGPDELSDEQRAAGEAACSAIDEEVLRDQCVYDVAVTGDEGFAGAYEEIVTATSVDPVPSGDQVFRIVNLYSNDTGPTALDVYAWADEFEPLLVATVPYGASSEWLDPGIDASSSESHISIQRQGEGVPLLQSLFDYSFAPDPGGQTSIVIASGPDTYEVAFGRPADYAILLEESTTGVPLSEAPPDSALLFEDITGLANTHPGATFYTSTGDGCLAEPGFEGLAALYGVSTGFYDQGVVQVEPGTDLPLTLHGGTFGEDPFAATCESAPIHGPLPLSIGPGQRSHFFLYATPGDETLRSLLLPFGE